MPEIEIKLDLSSESCSTVLGSGLLGEPEQILQQRSTYFDTPDRQLFLQGFTLRIRRTGEARVQTVKAAGQSADLFARSEWETPLEGNHPVLDHTSPLASEFGPDLDVRPMFDVDIERRVWNVDEAGSKIEVVLDLGKIVSGDRVSAVSEMELELKDGDASSLFVLARKLEAVAPVRFSVRSKAERGFVLLDAQRSAHKAERVHLERGAKTSGAFHAIASACFRHFRLNEDILLRQRNEEALHQTRVALRRLRSAFSIFKALLIGTEPQRLRTELRWLAGVLGEARNIDVLLAKAKNADIRRRLRAARETAYDEAVEALNSARARSLMLDFIDWLERGDHLTDAGTADIREAPASDFARAKLDRMRKKIKKQGRALAEADDEHRHEVRKNAKKLRYAAEFFSSLFDGKRGVRRYKRFITAMEALQDQLGALNDLATGPAVLEKHGLADHPARDSMISHDDRDNLIDTAQAALDDVADAKRFWK